MGRVAVIGEEAFISFTCNGIFHSVQHLECIEMEEVGLEQGQEGPENAAIEI